MSHLWRGWVAVLAVSSGGEPLQRRGNELDNCWTAVPFRQPASCLFLRFRTTTIQTKKVWMRNKQTNKLAHQTHPHKGSSHLKLSATHRSPTHAFLWMRPVHKEYRFLGRDAVFSGIIVPHYKGNCCLHLPRFLFVGYSQATGHFFDSISACVRMCRSSVCVWSKDRILSPVLWSAVLSFVDTPAGPGIVTRLRTGRPKIRGLTSIGGQRIYLQNVPTTSGFRLAS